MTIAHNINMKKKYLIIIPIIILFIISIIYLPNNLKVKQIIWCTLGIIFCLIISNINIKKILKFSWLYYFISIILLVLVLIINNYTNGSRGWINIGFISIQPSELMKISLILFTIKYYNKLNIWALLLTYLIPMILIFLEPDTGGIILEGIVLVFFILKKLNTKQLRKLIIVILLLITTIASLYLYNKDILIQIIGPSIFYRLDRIKNFLNDDSIQTTNAILSIANGKTLYFPEMFNDFFIAYILSKNIILVIPIVISTLIIIVVLKNKNTTIAQVAFYLVFFQCYWNIAMNLKLVPVIGIPYLFISYGGSHIITSMLLIGLAINNTDSNKVLEQDQV